MWNNPCKEQNLVLSATKKLKKNWTFSRYNTYQFFVFALILTGFLFGGFIWVLPSSCLLIHLWKETSLKQYLRLVFPTSLQTPMKNHVSSKAMPSMEEKKEEVWSKTIPYKYPVDYDVTSVDEVVQKTRCGEIQSNPNQLLWSLSKSNQHVINHISKVFLLK